MCVSESKKHSIKQTIALNRIYTCNITNENAKQYCTWNIVILNQITIPTIFYFTDHRKTTGQGPPRDLQLSIAP